MSKESEVPKSVVRARLGAVWGVGILLVLWFAMLGTTGEILLLLPTLFVIGLVLNFLGIATQESMLWRGVAVIVSAGVSSFIGYRCGPFVFAKFESLTTVTRVISILFLAVTLVMLILIGRHLTT